jgi:NAD(P)-dependent dehydrogenase (short-subunit alcohol dehydrogenase family)
VDIWPVPVETETAVPFAENTEHASYNAEALQADVSQAGDVRQLFEETEERFGASKTAIIREAIRAYVADPTHVLPSSA